MPRPPRPPRPIPLQLGDVFSVAGALAAGVSLRRLRHDSLESPFHGVRMQAATESEHRADADASPRAVRALRARARLLQRAEAYRCVMKPHAFFSGITAAALWGLPLPLGVLESVAGGEPLLDIGVLAPHRAPRSAGVRGRQFAPHLSRVVSKDRMLLTDPATTWVHLGAVLALDELIAIGDAIVHVPRMRGMRRGQRGLATIDDLAAALAAGRRHGATKLRSALVQIRVGNASTGETDVRLAMARAGLPAPELDFDVIAPDGTPIGFTEFAFPRWRVMVEYEGDHHRVSRAQWARDIDKHSACAALGWTVVRLTAAHVYPSREPAITRIRDALARAGWRPG